MADPLSFDDAKRLGWAEEETLKNLLTNSNITNATLRVIGDRYKGFGSKLDSRLAELGVVIEGSAKTPKPDSPAQKTTNNRLYKLTSSLQSVDRGIGHFSGMFNAKDASSMIGGLAYGLKGLATDAQYYGGALQGIVPQLNIASGLLKVFNSILGEINMVAGGMREMYAGGIGVATSLSGLTQAASDSGMRVTEFASLLAKHGRVAATIGTRATMDLSRQFQRMTGFGGQLMMGQKEAGEAFFETLEMMRNSGEMQGLSQENIARRGVNLLQNFNDLAVATGRNRDELRKQTADIMRQPLVNLWSRMLPEEGRRRLADMTARLAAEFGDQGATVANMIERVGQAGGGFGLMEEQFRPLIALAPGFGRALQDAARGIKDGSMTQEHAVRRLSNSFGSMSRQQLEMISRANPQLAGFVSQMLQAREAAEKSREQIEREASARGISVDVLLEERRSQTESMQRIQAGLNAAGASVTRFGQSFTKIAASLGGVIIPILEVFSSALDIVSSAFETLAGYIEPIANRIGSWMRIGGNDDADGQRTDGASFGQSLATIGIGVVMFKVLRWLAGAGAGLFSRTIGAVGNIRAGIFGRGAAAAAGVGANAATAAGKISTGPLGGIGRSMAGFVTGTGRAVSSALKGLASGISALGRPSVLRGILTMAALAAPLYLSAKAFQEFNTVDWESMAKAGVAMVAFAGAAAVVGGNAVSMTIGGAAIGSAIALIGAGIAGATWLVGSALPTLTEGLKGFENLDGSKLRDAAGGMTAISGALVSMSGGSLLSGFSQLFTGDPVNRLKRFAEIGPPLRAAADSMRAFGDSIQTSVDSINRLKQIDTTGLANLMSAARTTASMPASVAAGAGGNTVTIDQLNLETLQYYNATKARFSEMVDTLRLMLETMNATKDNNVRG